MNKLITELNAASKNKIIYQVDAFTNEMFKGNPAGVMILDEMPSEDYMQNLAMEMNLSETAFIVPEGKIYQIRFFTPKSELPIAGHPTLASAHILYEEGFEDEEKPIHFRCSGGELTVMKDKDSIVMNLPAFPIKKVHSKDKILESIGFQPLEIYESAHDWIVAIGKDIEEIKSASPNFGEMVKNGLGHMIITAESDGIEEDFVVRCFAPKLGVNEDPVTGSAHCALTPIWAQKLGKIEMRSLQMSYRTGRLLVKLLDDRVEIKGKAITVFKALLS